MNNGETNSARATAPVPFTEVTAWRDFGKGWQPLVTAASVSGNDRNDDGGCLRISAGPRPVGSSASVFLFL